MKLHLPKGLLVAVMAAGSVPQVFADTGYSSGEKTMYLGGAQAGHLSMPGNGTISTETEGTETTTTISAIDFSESGTSYKLVADDKTGDNDLTNARIETLTVAASSSLEIGTNSWNSARYFDTLVIDSLIVADNGTTSLNVSKAEHEVSIQSISGSFSSITNTGTLTIGSAINLSQVASNTGTLILKGAVNETDIAVSSGNWVIASAEASVTGKLYSNGGNITLGDGTNSGMTTVNRIELSDKQGGDNVLFTVESGYTLKVTGEANTIQDGVGQYKTNSFIVSEWSNSTTMNVKGTILAEKAAVLNGDYGVVINIENGGTLAARGLGRSNLGETEISTLNLKEGGKLILGDMGLDYDGYLNTDISGGTIGIAADSVTISDSLHITGSLSLDTNQYTYGESALTQGSTGGKLILNGNLTGSGSIDMAGAGTIQFGKIDSTVNLSAGTANVVYAGTLMLGEGATFTVGSGTYTLDVSDMDAFIVESGYIVDKEGNAATNGFSQGACSIISGGVIVGEFTVQYAGQSFTIDDSHRTFGSTDAIDTSKWFITTGSSSVSEVYEQSSSAVISVAAGGTLNVDAAVTTGVELSGNATMNISQGQTLSAGMVTTNNHALTLDGAGTYTINAGDSTSVSLADGWSGKLQLFDQSNGNVDLSALGHAGSTIEIKNYVGYFSNSTNGTKTISANIILNNTNLAPIELTNGYGGATYKFTGAMEGDGNFIVNKSGLSSPMKFSFAGDISKWTGDMVIASGEHEVTYTGDATTIKNDIVVRSTATSGKFTFDHTKAATVSGNISDNGKELEVVVKNTDTQGTTFSGTVDMTSASIEEGTTATFSNASITVDDVLVKAAAQLSFSGVESLSVAKLETQAGATLTVGSIENEKALTVRTQATFNGGTINANLTLADGASVEFNETVNMGSTLTLGSNMTLSGTKLEEIKSLTSAAQTVVLFTGVDTLTLGEQSFSMGTDVLDASDDVRLSNHFTTSDSTVDLSNYYLGFNAAGDLYAGLVIPEPATATLSLLALAGLCARRRRK